MSELKDSQNLEIEALSDEDLESVSGGNITTSGGDCGTGAGTCTTSGGTCETGSGNCTTSGGKCTQLPEAPAGT